MENGEFQWISSIRKIAKTDPEKFEKIKTEYLDSRCKDFCNKYRIGVNEALRVFWRKREKRKIEDSETRSVRIHKEYIKKIQSEKDAIKKVAHIPWDIDEYYSKRQP